MEVKHLTTLELKVLRELDWPSSHVAETSFVWSLPRDEYHELVHTISLRIAGEEFPHLNPDRLDIGAPIPLNILAAVGRGFRLLCCKNCIFLIDPEGSPAKDFLRAPYYCAITGAPGEPHSSGDRIVEADGICGKFEFSFSRHFEDDLYESGYSYLRSYVEDLSDRFQDIILAGLGSAEELELSELLDAIYEAKNDEEFLKGIDSQLIDTLRNPKTPWEKREKAVKENKKLVEYDASVLAAAKKALAERLGDDL